MNLNDLTLGDVKELRAMFGGGCGPRQSKRLPMPLGKTVFIRTVTHHYCGIVAECVEEEVALSDAAWIADDGRFADAMRTGAFNDVEPYPDGLRVVINRASVIDWTVVPFSPPRAQK